MLSVDKKDEKKHDRVRRPRRITIQDVARRAEVSVGTVSNALNSPTVVAPDTLSRIQAAMRELHFSPNALIRSLRRGHTNTVGVCCWTLETNPTYSITTRFLNGVNDTVAAARRDTLMFQWFPERSGAVMVDAFFDGRADSVIVLPGSFSPDDLSRLAESPLPIVMVFDDSLAGIKATVTIDNKQGITQVMRHLLGLGHRRIAYCGPQEATVASYDMKERFAAYQGCLHDAGLLPDPTLIIPLERLGLPPRPADVGGTLLLPAPPTAWVACNDRTARHLVDLLRGMNKRVPEDVSVAGFDDTSGAGGELGLTTVRNPAEQVGRLAAQFALQLEQGTPPSECQAVLPVELVVRSTTAAPPPTPLAAA